jgi:LacI family transcriptional regulator
MAVITISRQYGSGGDEVATRICEMLGYRCFDKRLMAQIASEMTLSDSEIVDFSEDDYKVRSFLDLLFGASTPRTVAQVRSWKEDATGARVPEVKLLDENQAIALVQATIEASYKQGNIVIVGRGGQAILKDKPGVVHVRIEAPLEIRVKRIQDQKNIDTAAALEMVTERDKASADYLKRFHDIDWSDPALYHLVINTGQWNTEATAHLIVNAVSYLHSKQTGTIALVLTDITNPFFTTVARGVEDTASKQGFSVMLCNTDESENKETEYLNVLLQKQVDGVLLVPACPSTESISLLQKRGVPVVVLDRRVPDAKVDTVRCHSEQAAYQLVRHLLDLGHERIAVLSGPRVASTAADRVAGYRRALAEAGLGGGAEMVYYGEFSRGSGYYITQEALAGTPRPTALFATNNFIAIGALRALREARLRVPEDISMVVFDDLPASLVVEPFFTAAVQPAYEMGHKAAELLLTRLAGEGPAEPQEIVLPTEVIVRKSSSYTGSR